MKNIEIKKFKKNRKAYTKVLAGLSFLTLLGTLTTAQEENIKNKKNIIVAQGSKPRSLDPYKYNEFPLL